MTLNKSALIASLAFFGSVFLSGCSSASGDFFAKEKHIEKDLSGKSQVIVYRYKQYAGSADEPDVIDNGKNVGTIKNGGFISYTTTPGLHKVHTSTAGIDKAVNITLEPGAVYYMRADFQPAWIGFWRMSVIYPEQAIGELNSTRLSM